MYVDCSSVYLPPLPITFFFGNDSDSITEEGEGGGISHTDITRCHFGSSLHNKSNH